MRRGRPELRLEGDFQPRSRAIPWDHTIIYETHVRGFTKVHPAVPERQRGTYKGFGTREVVDYVKALGVTTVELLPIHTFINDSHLLERGLTNYWGYNSIGFFSTRPAVPLGAGAEPAGIQGDGGALP